MKKICPLLFTLLMCTVATKAATPDSISVVNADGVKIFYNFINDRTELEVTTMPSIEKYTGDIVIPETVTYGGKTYKVTRIGDKAFQSDDPTSVTIPNSVTSIGEEAFYNCWKMTSITIGNSVETIAENAFYGCRVLTSVTIPQSMTSIGKSAFAGCTALTSLVIEDAPVSLGFKR